MRQRFFAQLYPVLQALWKYRYLIVLPMMILPFVATFINGLKPKHYYSHTTILVQETALMNPFLEDLSISFHLEERMEALRVMIHSRYILNEVIHSLALAPANNPNELNRMRNKLSGGLRLSLAGSDLIKIGLSWDRPEQMVPILEAVSKQFLERLQAPGKTSVSSSEQFLEQQLKQTQAELEAAEQTLANFKRDNIDNLPQIQGNQTQNVSQLESQLRETELALRQAEIERKVLKKRLINANPVMSLLEEELIQAEARLTILRARYTDNHSEVKAVLRRVNTLRQESKRLLARQNSLSETELNQLWTVAANLGDHPDTASRPLLISQLEQYQQAESHIESLQQKLLVLRDQIQTLTRKRSEFAELEKSLKSLERNFDVKEKIYNRLLERYEMAQVTGELGRFEEQDKLKIIDIPYTPTQPTNWPWWISFILGIVGGLGLGLSMTTLMVLTDTRIYATEQVQRITRTAVLGRIPAFRRTDEEHTHENASFCSNHPNRPAPSSRRHRSPVPEHVTPRDMPDVPGRP
ncbi:GumC family protein [Photobacterium atrarenae]|uniref:Sugar transporter n=1 Tax=Photobacterium atrarenae TaxID=865757 RepID=A0ABY5GBZ5_9GAMM|nr:sugar transporter [Photobacterium atrarenae]UTV26735.1 sugar transporter [Photobacterium atrarenae]